MGAAQNQIQDLARRWRKKKGLDKFAPGTKVTPRGEKDMVIEVPPQKVLDRIKEDEDKALENMDLNRLERQIERTPRLKQYLDQQHRDSAPGREPAGVIPKDKAIQALFDSLPGKAPAPERPNYVMDYSKDPINIEGTYKPKEKPVVAPAVKKDQLGDLIGRLGKVKPEADPADKALEALNLDGLEKPVEKAAPKDGESIWDNDLVARALVAAIPTALGTLFQGAAGAKAGADAGLSGLGYMDEMEKEQRAAGLKRELASSKSKAATADKKILAFDTQTGHQKAVSFDEINAEPGRYNKLYSANAQEFTAGNNSYTLKNGSQISLSISQQKALHAAAKDWDKDVFNRDIRTTVLRDLPSAISGLKKVDLASYRKQFADKNGKIDKRHFFNYIGFQSTLNAMIRMSGDKRIADADRAAFNNQFGLKEKLDNMMSKAVGNMPMDKILIDMKDLLGKYAKSAKHVYGAKAKTFRYRMARNKVPEEVLDQYSGFDADIKLIDKNISDLEGLTFGGSGGYVEGSQRMIQGEMYKKVKGGWEKI